MPSRSWKKVHPISYRHAMELCVGHAKERLNRSIDNIADLMGLESKWMIYKWIESGRIPGILIYPFENACGIDLITHYEAHRRHKLLIDVPTGRKATHQEITQLSLAMNETSTSLIKFHEGRTSAEETIAAITGVMESLAWHRGTVEKTNQPELDLEGDQL